MNVFSVQERREEIGHGFKVSWEKLLENFMDYVILRY